MDRNLNRIPLVCAHSHAVAQAQTSRISSRLWQRCSVISQSSNPVISRFDVIDVLNSLIYIRFSTITRPPRIWLHFCMGLSRHTRIYGNNKRIRLWDSSVFPWKACCRLYCSRHRTFMSFISQCAMRVKGFHRYRPAWNRHSRTARKSTVWDRH